MVIKKQITFILILFTVGFGLYAEDKPFELNGSFEFSISDKNLLNNQYAGTEVGPAFDSTLNLNTIFSEPLNDETLEMGMSIDLNSLNNFIEGKDSDSSYTSSDNNLYTKIQKMIDWYINNKARYGMSDYPGNYSANGGWPETLYGTSTRYQFIIGNTVEDIDSVAWTSEKWDDASQLYTEIKTHIKDEIYAISNKVDRADDVDQFTMDSLTSDEKEQVLKEKEAVESFNDAYLGSSTDPEMGELFTSGYIKIKSIFNILDLTMEYKGSNVEIGRSLSSTRASQENSLIGMRLDLALDEEILPNLSAGVLVVLTDGEESETEDWESMDYDMDEGESGDLGILLNGGYSIKSVGSLDMELGLLDIKNPTNFILAVYPTIDIWHKNKLKIEGEFDMFGYSDEKVEDDSLKLGMGAAIDMQATFYGVTPRVKALWKNDQFFGENSANLEEDRLPGTSYMDDFNSSNVKMAGALDAGLIFDTSKLFGREILSVGGGLNLFAYDPLENLDTLRYGWYAGMVLKLKDTTEIPLTVDLNVSRYDHSGLVEFADYEGTGVDTSLISGVSWNVTMNYIYSENLEFLATSTGADTGNRFTNEPVITWGLSVISKF